MRAFAEVVGDFNSNSDSDSDCEFGFRVELEFRHGVVSFFEFCEHNNHSTIMVSTIIQPAAHIVNATVAHTHLRCSQHKQAMQQHTPRAIRIHTISQHTIRIQPTHNQRAISLSQSNCRNQSVAIRQSVAISLSQSVCRNHDQSVTTSQSQSVCCNQPVAITQSQS